MNEEILTLYESYFKNPDNFKIFIQELQDHDRCFFCVSDKNTKVFHCKTDVARIILKYLEHLKLIQNPCWKRVKYFFKSITISGFFDEKNTGKWQLINWKEKNIYILCYFGDYINRD